MSLTQKQMAQGTSSNYIHLIIKIIASLVLVRIMFLGMPSESYGFWALLWSIFGYTVLLDFGLGVTIQKKAATLIVLKEEEKISALFSTYLFAYSLIASIIAITTLILAYNIEHLFIIGSMERLADYRLSLIIFGLGSAIAFILGFIAEILRGMHLLQIRNKINTVFVILNAVGLWLCVTFETPLYMFALVASVIQVMNNIAFLFVIKKVIPSLQIRKSLVDIDSVKDSMKFSLSAYMVTFSNIIIFRTDQIIVSAIAGVAFAGFYQIAARVSELFRQFATQFHESLGTKAAMLSQHNDSDALASLLISSNKIVAGIATLLFIPSYLLIDALLFHWLDLSDKDTIFVAKVLLVSMYILVVFRSSMVQVLLMNNKHIQLMKVGIFEAVANIVLSIYLVQQYGMIGAAIGTLIPNLLLAIFYNIPTALRYSHMSLLEYFTSYLIPLMLSLVLTLFIGHSICTVLPADTLWLLVLDGFILVLLFVLSYGVLGFYKELKEKISGKAK